MGKNSIMINETLFVDAKYGSNSSGQRNNAKKPYRTLKYALSKAKKRDIIYVRPGVYDENNIELRNKINWYFELGAIIKNTTINTSIFTITHNITSKILGYGSFISTQNILNQIFGLTNLIFEGVCFENTSDYMFLFNDTNTCKSKIIISGEVFKANNILYLNGNTNIIFNFDHVKISNQIVNITSACVTELIIHGNLLDRICTTNTDGFLINSNAIDLEINIQELNSSSSGIGYVVNIDLSMTIVQPTVAAKLNFNFQRLNIIGGVLIAVGFPTQNPLIAPELTMHIQRIDIDYTGVATITTSPFIIDMAIKLLSYQVMICNLARALYLYEMTNGNSFLEGQVTLLNQLDTSNKQYLMNCDGGFVTFDSSLINVNEAGLFLIPGINSGGGIVCLGDNLSVNQSGAVPISMIKNLSGQVDINISQISFSHNPTSPPNLVHTFDIQGINNSNGNLTMNFDNLYIQVNPASQNFANIFNMSQYTSLYLNGNQFGTENSNAAIYSDDDIYVDLLCQNCNDSNAYIISGKSNIHILELNNSINTNNFTFPGTTFVNNSVVNNYPDTTIDIGELNQNTDNFMFNGMSGNFHLIAKRLNYNGNTNIFDLKSSTNLTGIISEINISSAGNSNCVFNTAANTIANITTINCYNNGSQNNTSNILHIYSDVNGNGTFNGNIDNINLINGYLLFNESNNDFNLNFNSIYKNGSNSTPDGNLVQINGNSNNFINGQHINVNNCDTIFILGNNNNVTLTLNLDSLTMVNINKEFDINGCGGSINILKTNVYNNTPTLSNLFSINNTNLQLNITGQSIIVDPNIPNIPTVFAITTSSNVHIDVDYISNPGRIISGDTSGVITFKNNKSILTNNIDTQMFTFENYGTVNLDGNVLESSAQGSNLIEFLAGVRATSNFKSITGLYRIVYINTSNEVWFYSEKSITSSNAYPVYGLQAPNGATGVITLGGYMKTNSTRCIEIISDINNYVYPGLRLLGSIIINDTAGNSIFSTLPITVSVQPSSANSDVSFGVDIIPKITYPILSSIPSTPVLFIDSALF